MKSPAMAGDQRISPLDSSFPPPLGGGGLIVGGEDLLFPAARPRGIQNNKLV